MRIRAERTAGNQRPAVGNAQSLLSAAISALVPGGGDQRLQAFPRCAGAQSTSKIGALSRIQAKVPEPVRGQTASVARSTKRCSGGGDDAEDQSIRQSESLRGGRGLLEQRLNRTIVTRQDAQHLGT